MANKKGKTKKASEKTAKVEEAKVASEETANIPEVEESYHVNTLSDDSPVPSVNNEAVLEFVEASVPEVVAELEEKIKNGELPNNAPVEEETKTVEHTVKKEEKPKRKTIDEVYGHCWFGVPD